MITQYTLKDLQSELREKSEQYSERKLLFKEPFSDVYSAQHQLLQKDYFIKEYRGKPELEKIYDSDYEELQTTSNLSPSLIPLCAYHLEEGNKLCAVFDISELICFKDFLKTTQLSSKFFEEEEIIKIGFELIKILKHLKENQKYCTLDPLNVYIDKKSNSIRLFIDYEIRKVYGLETFFSSYYTDPQVYEAISRSQAYQTYPLEASLWSLGALLFEMCCSDISLLSENSQNIFNTIPSRYSNILRTCIEDLLKPRDQRITLEDLEKQLTIQMNIFYETKKENHQDQEEEKKIDKDDVSQGIDSTLNNNEQKPITNKDYEELKENKYTPQHSTVKKERGLNAKGQAIENANENSEENSRKDIIEKGQIVKNKDSDEILPKKVREKKIPKKLSAESPVKVNMRQNRLPPAKLNEIFAENPDLKSFIQSLYEEIYQVNTPQLNPPHHDPNSQKSLINEHKTAIDSFETVTKAQEDSIDNQEVLLNEKREKSKTFYREEKYRVKDAINRIIVGDDKCCASTFYKGCYYISSNMRDYQNENSHLKVKLSLEYQSYDDKIQISPKLLFQIFDYKKGYQQPLKIDGKAILCEKVTTKFILAVTNLAQTFNLSGLQSYINDERISYLYEKSFPISINNWHEAPKLYPEIRETEVGSFILNPFRRRYAQFINYMVEVHNVHTLTQDYVWNAETKVPKATLDDLALSVDNKLRSLLHDSILWKASSWCTSKKQKIILSDLKPNTDLEFYQEFKEFFVKFYSSWKQSGESANIKRDYSKWIKNCNAQVKNNELKIPSSFKKKYTSRDYVKTFLNYCSRYLIDVEEIQSYIIRDSTLNGSLLNWMLNYDSSDQGKYLEYVAVPEGEDIHCEMKILTKFLNEGILHDLDYISTSLLCCPHCYFTLVRFKFPIDFKNNQEETSQKINGFHGNISTTWKLPSIIKNMQENMKIWLGDVLYEQYKKLKTKKVEGNFDFEVSKNQADFVIEVIENIGDYTDKELNDLIGKKKLKNDEKQLPDIPSGEEKRKDSENNDIYSRYGCNTQ